MASSDSDDAPEAISFNTGKAHAQEHFKEVQEIVKQQKLRRKDKLRKHHEVHKEQKIKKQQQLEARKLPDTFLEKLKGTDEQFRGNDAGDEKQLSSINKASKRRIYLANSDDESNEMAPEQEPVRSDQKIRPQNSKRRRRKRRKPQLFISELETPSTQFRVTTAAKQGTVAQNSYIRAMQFLKKYLYKDLRMPAASIIKNRDKKKLPKSNPVFNK